MKKHCFALSLAVVLGAASILGGCSGKAGAQSEEAGELYVYNWGEYIDEEVIAMFEEETGIKVIYDMFETNEEMYPVIEAGGVTYDAVCPSDCIQKLQEAGNHYHKIIKAEKSRQECPERDQAYGKD